MKIGKQSKVYIFAEIGKTPYSSQASEKLLEELVSLMKRKYKYFAIKLFFYPIFYFFKDVGSFLFSNLEINQNKDYIILFSTSIKFLRDFLYILQSFLIIILSKPNLVFFYNLNEVQISILKFLNIFNINVNLIQADGFVIGKDQYKIFRNIIVFSMNTKQIYSSYLQNKNVYFALPYINKEKLNYTPNFKFSPQNKINIVHCGAISQYNLPEEYVLDLIEICDRNKNFNLQFTTSQNKIPTYFRKLIDRFPENINFLGNCDKEKLSEILEKSDFALDLRNDFRKEHISTDFPSKLFLYMRYDLYIFSTIANSIPKEISSILIPFYEINNLENLNFNSYNFNIKNALDYINKKSLNSNLEIILRDNI